jgi:hypothetical protein
LLLDVGIAQRVFKGRELMAMDTRAPGEKHALRHRKHRRSVRSNRPAAGSFAAIYDAIATIQNSVRANHAFNWVRIKLLH